MESCELIWSYALFGENVMVCRIRISLRNAPQGVIENNSCLTEGIKAWHFLTFTETTETDT